MLSINKLKLVIIFSIILPTLSHALPMEWHGVFAVDHHSYQNYRGMEENNYDPTNLGSQEPMSSPEDKSNAAFQSYILKLRPSLTINDSASFFTELTTGYGRGSVFGDGPVQNFSGSMGNALYHINQANYNNPINLNQFYMELYSDTATYQIGRSPDHFGMGLVINDGHETWDRFASTRDQIKVNFKIGNFSINPFIGKIGAGGSLTTSTHAYEFGIPLFYEVAETDLTFGVLWVNRTTSSSFDGYRYNLTSSPTDPSFTGWKTLGRSNVNLIAGYLKKIWGKFKGELEVDFFTGGMNDLYVDGEETKYRAFSGVLNLGYKFSENWSMGFDAGYVSGDDGGMESFDAMYLNPNYNIADILFRYNANAISDRSGLNPFDQYVTNTTFLRLYGGFVTGKWNMDLTFIYAMANEVAEVGDKLTYDTYNHQTNKIFIAKYDQDKNLGFEIDYNLEYKWNDEIHIGFDMAYLAAGEYWAYNGDQPANTLKDPWLFRLKASLDF